MFFYLEEKAVCTYSVESYLLNWMLASRSGSGVPLN